MAADEERGVVRVKVKKCEGALPVEFRSFAVDPQITSLEVLQHILIRAFELNGKRNFGISYLSRDRGGVEVYLSLLSDWDLDAAFVSAAKPYLQLKMDIKPSEDSPVLEDWDIISPKDVIGSDQLSGEKRSLAAAALPFTQSLLSQVTDDVLHPVSQMFYQPFSAAFSQMGRTLSRVQQALSWSYGEEVKPFKPPLSDAEFHSYLNGQGQLTRPEELRLRIYHGGVEPSLRKVVWRYLLNVYPDGLTGQERMDYMKKKTREYDQLKREWTARASSEDLEFIRGNVLKDVLRTDRAHPYYAGSEDSPHLTALTDLLTTFAITHPQVSYCQGMSDIASPILAVMDNEAHAFICFCGIMKRLEGNFRPDGQLMSVKFQHLKLLLQYSDPEFYAYLVSRGADDLFFCYRWLLLELKREFAFDDALRMLEVTWSSLPPDPPETEVELVGPPLESEKPLNFEQGCGMAVSEEKEEEQKLRQRKRHMLRPSREEADGERKVTVEEKSKYDAGCLPRDYGVKNNGEPVPPFEKQPSFGEFKYYSARNDDSFDMGDKESAVSPMEFQSPHVPSSLLPARQSTEESEEDPSEREPLIRSQAKTSEMEARISPSGEAASPASPLPPHLPSWINGSSQPTWRGMSPEPAPSKCHLSTLTNGTPASPEKTSARLASSPSTSHGNKANSPSTLTGKPTVLSPSLSCPQNRSLLSSPVLSFGKSTSLPKPFSSNLPSPSSKASSSVMNSPNSNKLESGTIKPCSLPPPQEFGKGNPFMLFLCLSILLEHRDHIVKNSLDYNELAMHFDRLVRRHNLGRILQRAKALFADYLQSEVWDSEEGDEVSLDSPTTAEAGLHSPSTRPGCPSRHSPTQAPSPNSTYNLASTVPSPTTPAALSPSSS
ncbi:TBC1 domain family member 25-like isoform X2 [Denticeps clupeoides]|uniref:TBC1 domain family member 25-like isoform X2 n=1 Tax=Denticeps clupeoides TaxID=299321 RepID=UPI0010A3F650|nr:TBC1 domain family member 25-like isoform X2 [Denticeps clupeoides]